TPNLAARSVRRWHARRMMITYRDVRESHSEQRSASLRHRRRPQRARQPRAQLSAAVNAAPSQELLVIRRNHQSGEVSLDPLRWGLIPYWCKDPAGGRKPINAKCETVRDLPTYRVPVSGMRWSRLR